MCTSLYFGVKPKTIKIYKVKDENMLKIMIKNFLLLIGRKYLNTNILQTYNYKNVGDKISGFRSRFKGIEKIIMFSIMHIHFRPYSMEKKFP